MADAVELDAHVFLTRDRGVLACKQGLRPFGLLIATPADLLEQLAAYGALHCLLGGSSETRQPACPCGIARVGVGSVPHVSGDPTPDDGDGEDRCAHCGLTRGEALCVREYEVLRRCYGGHDSPLGPLFPPTVGGHEHNPLCPLYHCEVVGEDFVGRIEVGWLTRCRRGLREVAFRSAREDSHGEGP
jgi:hypothetical protein